MAISLFQMGMVALAPVISAITQAFPSTSQLTVQMVSTFLNLLMVLAALLSGAISKVICRRNMAIIGVGLLVVVSVCGCFFATGLWAVFCWSGLLGIGMGLFVPVASSMLVDYFDDDERKPLAGRQTAVVNLGGVLLSLLSGIIASQRWNNAYLIFLGAIPVLLMCIKFLPHEEVKPDKTKHEMKTRTKIPPIVWIRTLQTMVFAVVYFTFSTNISLLLTEKGYASASLAGAATACFMLGGGVCGLLFTRITALLKSITAIGAFVLVGASFMCIYCFDGLISLFIAAFLGGGSLSIIFPYFLVTTSEYIDPTISVLSTSLIISVGPNFGSFLSPLIITNLSALFDGTSVRFRFCVASILAMLLAVLQLVLNIKKNGRESSVSNTAN